MVVFARPTASGGILLEPEVEAAVVVDVVVVNVVAVVVVWVVWVVAAVPI